MGRAHLGSLLHLPNKDVSERAAAPLRMRKQDLFEMAFPSDSTPAIRLLLAPFLRFVVVSVILKTTCPVQQQGCTP
jgi:hypothetical protein